MKLSWIGFLLMGAYIFLGALAPWLAPFDPYEMDVNRMLMSPGGEHWLGTDRFGRDLWSRVLYGTRISLMVSFGSVSVALFVGSGMGVLAGYFRGWVDALISRVVDTLFVIPGILLALAIMAVLGTSLRNLVIAIGIIYIPIFARIARGATLSVRETPYVEAARALGVSHLRMLTKYILPNISGPLIVQTTLSLAFAILAEAALGYLGLGGEPDQPSFGMMLSHGKDWMEQAWWVAVFPGLAISLAVFSFNVIGDWLSNAWDPRTR